MKAMNPNGAFCLYLIRYFDMQSKIENDESKWCILPLLIRYFDMQTPFVSIESRWCILPLFNTIF